MKKFITLSVIQVTLKHAFRTKLVILMGIREACIGRLRELMGIVFKAMGG